MSLSSPLSSGSMASSTFSSLKDPNTLKSESDTQSATKVDSEDTATSPPVTPPTKSSGPDASSGMHSTTLPSPPPSSSSRSKNHNEAGEDDSGSIEKIARRLSSPTRHSPSERGNTLAGASGSGSKTHSSSSSTSDVHSHHHHQNNNNAPSPSSIHSKHAAIAKTKTLGHLNRSTSSEVDNEVAHALASGRSIVSKTDWKEDDAQFLVQLIETQFPKGNIIWEWVGQQMVSRGFTKSQCRSKWKRIRTKVLHGDGSQSTKDRDYRENDSHASRFHEPDELVDDDDDEPMATAEEASRWHSRQESGRSYGSTASGGMDHQRSSRGQPHLSSSRYRSRSPTTMRQQHQHTSERDIEEEENEIWSDEEDSNRNGYNNGYGRNQTNHYQSYDDHNNSSPAGRQRQHSSTTNTSHYRHTSPSGPEDPRISAIAATPNSFGKIEWKAEDSDFLVRLIETKFASRKVDWAWVSKQMEGRGYDRTQCKSRWWRVQHRQNHGGSHHHGSNGLNGGGSRSHGGARQRQESGGTLPNRLDEKDALFDSENENEDTTITPPQGEYASESLPQHHQGRENMSMGSRASSVSEGPDSRSRQEHEGSDAHDFKPHDEHQQQHSSTSDGRKTVGAEHQKHIEWKEDDSRYMYRLIEREFPVGNVVWSVIAEKMASRGYSQTQCMSKWRRHLKHTKLSGEGNKTGGGGMSMDLDMTDMASVTSGGGGNLPTSVAPEEYRQTRVESGAKRIKTGGPRDSIGGRLSEDYSITSGQLDARLVEMEYDRYYDAGGKRRRTEDGEEDLQYTSHHDANRHGGQHHRRHHHGHHHHGQHHSHDHRSNGQYDRSPYDDRYDSQIPAAQDGYRYKDHHEAQYYADYYRDERDALTVPPASHHRQHGRERSYDDNSYPPHSEDIDRESANGLYERQQLAAVTVQGMEEEQEEQQPPLDESHRELHHDNNNSNNVQLISTSATGGEPQLSWTDEQQREGGHSLPANVEEMAYRDGYGPNGQDYDSAPSSGQRDSRGMVVDSERSHRPAEPVPRSRPIARSPERGFMGTTRERIPASYDDYPPPRESRRREVYPSRHERPSASLSRYHPHDDYEYDRRARTSRFEDDFVDPMIDYAMEDDLDWATGRWESRDMARLAAAVARQGRRWDAIRERIRVPVLVSPYDDDEDVYDGVRFEPVVPYYRSSSDSRRVSQSQPSYYQSSVRPRSHSHGHHPSQSNSHRQSYQQQQQQLYQPRQSGSHQRPSHGREYVPRLLKGPSSSSSKRAALPRTIPEVVDVDLTADGPSGDERQIDERMDVSMQVDQESLSELASAAVAVAAEHEEKEKANLGSQASVQENPEIEMEETTATEDQDKVEVPEQMMEDEEEEEEERVSDETDRVDVVRQDTDDKIGGEGDMSVEVSQPEAEGVDVADSVAAVEP